MSAASGILAVGMCDCKISTIFSEENIRKNRYTQQIILASSVGVTALVGVTAPHLTAIGLLAGTLLGSQGAIFTRKKCPPPPLSAEAMNELLAKQQAALNRLNTLEASPPSSYVNVTSTQRTALRSIQSAHHSVQTKERALAERYSQQKESYAAKQKSYDKKSQEKNSTRVVPDTSLSFARRYSSARVTYYAHAAR